MSARSVDTLPDIAEALAGHGLIARGGFSFDAGENAPAGPGGSPARSVVLVGQAGASVWPYFSKWRAERPEVKNPLDTWSREVIEAAARRLGARAVFPSDKPFLPFQQWAIRAEGLKPSPLGILMHPQYGLWHAYRGALLFDTGWPGAPPVEKPIHLCDLCDGKPCLSACPVNAYSEAGFAYQTCLEHVRSERGMTCMTGGCLARNACPYGQAYRYPAEVQAYHQGYFAG
jgi:hypothetical protein